MTVVSPVWWRLGTDGRLISSADPDHASAVQERNVAMWPAVTGFDADVHHLVLADPKR